VIGAQTLHATGYAMGVQRDGDVGTGDPERDAAVIAYFGDGATAQGDVNEAFVFASVQNAPVVFFCQNNQWAISEPSDRQTRIPLYRRAAGFGFPGVRVDGNDVIAVYAVTRQALERARSGNGPTFVEAYTYRMGAHTTSDDPTRYRISAEVDIWKHRDPILRLRTHLVAIGAADDAYFAAVDAEGDELAVNLREGCRAMPDPEPESMFTHAYAEPHPMLDAEQAEFAVYHESFVAAGAGGEPLMPQITLAKAINTGLRAAMDADPSVLLMGEDIGTLGGVFRVTDGLAKDFGEHRVIDTPLPSRASSAPPSAWPCAATGRSARSSSTASSTPRSTRSSASWPRCALGRSASSRCRSSSGSRSAAASAQSSTTARATRPTSPTPPDCGWCAAPTRSMRTS
jgi:hypothetical protein